MRSQYLTVLTGIALTLLTQTSCALVGLDTPKDEYENDPVAQAAIKLRHENTGQTENLSRAPAASEELKSMASSQDLSLGMSMSGVRSIWGEPQDVETAGDSTYGNQRWTYFNGASSSAWNIRGSRVVYFEQGRVAGWETH